MWIVVLMLGVLNTTPQFPAGHSEMTDFPAPFESEAACKASLYAIVENAQGDMDARSATATFLWSAAAGRRPVTLPKSCHGNNACNPQVVPWPIET